MKILISGLPGTGKSTIARKISKEHNFRYISDWEVFEKNNITFKEFENKISVSEKYSQLILMNIDTLMDDSVMDLEYSISPKDFVKYNKGVDIKIVYLGFIDVEEKLLFDLFRKSESNNEYSDEELLQKIKFYKEMSVIYKEQCKSCGLEFFDINKDRKEVQVDILNHLNFSC